MYFSIGHSTNITVANYYFIASFLRQNPSADSSDPSLGSRHQFNKASIGILGEISPICPDAILEYGLHNLDSASFDLDSRHNNCPVNIKFGFGVARCLVTVVGCEVTAGSTPISALEPTQASQNPAFCSLTPSADRSQPVPFNLHFGFPFLVSRFGLSIFLSCSGDGSFSPFLSDLVVVGRN